MANLTAHIKIARPDHWIKNAFVLPGIVVAIPFRTNESFPCILSAAFFGLLATCLIASSNYVINEVLDAPFDKCHPIKRNRPVPSGQVNIPLAYGQWVVLMVAGLSVATFLSWGFVLSMITLWIMGLIYNIPPVRAKDLPYVDILVEAINNPLRFLAGWYIIAPAAIPPTSLLLSYWMVGCYFMTIKRFAEFREINNETLAAKYRKSFARYTEPRLLVAIMFFASTSMLFFGAFLVRYRFELILSFPLIATVMAIYFRLSFFPHSAAQAPEKLFRSRTLMLSSLVCVIVMLALLFIDIPFLHTTFRQTPTIHPTPHPYP